MNLAIFFGQYLIVATALNFQYGNAGIPNMSNNLSVAVGAYTVSSLVFRISMWVVESAGVTWVPGWVSGNPYNATTMTHFMRTNPLLGIALYLVSIALALVFGSILGYVLAVISGGLRATYLMMFLYIISSAGRVIAANNEWTVMSIGKNITKLRREVMMFSSGLMAVTGVLMAFYYNFVQANIYDQTTYTIWPWLMITIGGTGNNAGALIGVIVGVALLKGFTAFNLIFGQAIASTGRATLILRYENVLLGILLVAFLALKPRGLIPEKQLYIPGINYKGLVKGSKIPEQS